MPPHGTERPRIARVVGVSAEARAEPSGAAPLAGGARRLRSALVTSLIARMQDAAGFDAQDLGDPVADFIEVVRDEDQWGPLGVFGPVGEVGDQLLPTTDVEAGGRFVEENEAGVVHERAR